MGRRSRRAGTVLLAVLLLPSAVSAGAIVYVAVPVAHDLYAVKSLFASHALDVETDEIGRARQHLADAQARLESPPARVLRRVPVLGSQVDAVDGVADAAMPVLDAELALDESLERMRQHGVLADGGVDFSVVAGIEAALRSAALALGRFERAVDRASDTLMAPIAAGGLNDMIERIRSLRAGAEDGLELLGIAPGVFGSNEIRRYLVLLINNAELRGAGGILAGAGSLTVSDGRFELGRFYDIDELVRKPYLTVPAPRDYARRFSTYKANTTLWVNTTMSPDFFDVALVAARLFERVTGLQIDGVIGIDPRGLALTMPSSASVRVPKRAEPLTAETFPRFAYSESYSLYRNQDFRKQVVIQAGLDVFRSILNKDWDEYGELEEVAHAIAGGHLRVVSFWEEEASVLTARRATGTLTPPERDALLVVSHNFGGGGRTGSKLDYWAERRIGHRCDIAPDGSASCITQLNVENVAPIGLVPYVAGRPYALLRNFVEFYVPATATITAVDREGKPVRFWRDREAGHTVIGTYIEVTRGREATLAVKYELGPAQSYHLVAAPQPLARDASLHIELSVPPGWTVVGPGSARGRIHEFEGFFRGPIAVRASRL